MTHLVVLTVAAIVLAGCSGRAGEDEAEAPHPNPLVTVAVAPVTFGDVRLTVSAVGATQATRREKVFAPASGRLVQLHVLEGSVVKRGDVLALLLPKESQAALSGAEALYRAATTEVQRREAERMRVLARSSQSLIPLIAKFDGVVATRSVSEGELVQENGELVSLVDLSSISFVADIPLRDIGLVRVGSSAEVWLHTLPNDVIHAVVDAILPQSDAQSQSVKTRLGLRHINPGARSTLRTEMAGTARISVGVRRHVLLVPKSAILRDDEKNVSTVLVVTPDLLAKSVRVDVGVVADSLAEVASPELRAGLPVITEGNYALADSTKVVIGGAGMK